MTAEQGDACRPARRFTIGGRRRGRRGPKRFALRCLQGGMLMVVIVAMLAIAAVVRMGAGPITIDGLGQTIARALQDRFRNGLRFAVGGTSLVQHGFGPALTIDRLSVTGPEMAWRSLLPREPKSRRYTRADLRQGNTEAPRSL